MRIRRIFVLLLCLCVGAALFGCGKQPDEPISVGICLADSALPIHTAAKDALTAQFQHAALSEAKGDAALQLRQAEVYLQEEYSLLVVEPVDKQTGLAIADLANQHETPILFIEFSDDQKVVHQAPRSSHIGYSPYTAKIELKKLMEQLPNGGDTNQDGEVSCLLVTAPSWDGFQETVAQYFTDGTDDGLQILVLPCDGTSQSAQEVCDQALATYGRDIEVVITTHEDIASGALSAIEDRGWYPGRDNYVLSVSKQDCSWLLQEGASGVVFPDAETYGSLVVSMVDDLLPPTPKPGSALASWIIKR